MVRIMLFVCLNVVDLVASLVLLAFCLIRLFIRVRGLTIICLKGQLNAFAHREDFFGALISAKQDGPNLNPPALFFYFTLI